jgi:hypothetical protein
MPFTTTGRVHVEGICNEKAVCAFLNTASTAIRTAICPPSSVVEHRGGTTTKADAEIVGSPEYTGISIKNHSSKTGTLDWVNSSAAVPNKVALNNELNVIKMAHYGKAESLATVRAQVSSLLNKHLMNLTTDEIRAVMKTCYDAYPRWVIINDALKKRLVCFEMCKNVAELKTFDSDTYCLKASAKGRVNATSMRILRRTSTGEEIDTKIRLRLVLNNGVNAFLGLSEKNKTSIPTLKLQHDDVAHLIRTLVDPIEEPYSAAAPADSSEAAAPLA